MTSTTQTLGRLEPVDPRSIWPSEPANFTPWLALEDNIRHLGDALGLELEVIEVERGVGRYAADILCKDTVGGGFVLIENQLEQSDHGHLGQLLTYCAGLSGAGEEVTVAVWIARRFTEEHRAALDWMNAISGDSFQFFGLEIELWRIGGSPPAPKFNIVSKPNDWSRAVATASKEGACLTDTQTQQLEYWSAFREHLQSKNSFLKATKAQPQSWFDLALGRSGFNLTAVASTYDLATQQFSGGQVRAMLNVFGAKANGNFAALQMMRDEVEQEFGEQLCWYAPKESKARRIYVSRPAEIGRPADWPMQHEWLRAKLERLHRVFAKRIKALKPLPEASEVGQDFTAGVEVE